MAEQIRVSERNWKWLNALKEPGDSFNDVLNRMREHRLADAEPTGVPADAPRTEPDDPILTEDNTNDE